MTARLKLDFVHGLRVQQQISTGLDIEEALLPETQDLVKITH